MEHGKCPPERMQQRVATVGPSAARLVQELLTGRPYQHATVLHVPGFDHAKLPCRFRGRDFRLTDVSGEVVEKLLV